MRKKRDEVRIKKWTTWKMLLLNLHLEAPCRDELERYYLHSVNQST